MFVRFLLAFACSNQNREGELLSNLSQYPSEHVMSGLRSVEQLIQGLHRLFHAVRRRLNSCFTLKQAGGGMLSPDLVHITAMALEAQCVPQVLVGVLTAFLWVVQVQVYSCTLSWY
jgi:hypothetical protein